MIVEGKKTATAPELRCLVAATNLPPSAATSAIHALWALHGLGQLDDAMHHAALLSQRAELRRNAVRALGNDAHSQTLFFGAGVISDPDLVTRLAAFVKLSEFPTGPADPNGRGQPFPQSGVAFR